MRRLSFHEPLGPPFARFGRHLQAVLIPAVACFVAACLSLPAPASAADNASISGIVVDQLGGAIAGASVTLLRDGADVSDTKSGADGRFTFSASEPARYAVRATSDGFLARTLDPFFVGTDARLSVKVTLSIGISQVETVTGTATELPISQLASPVTVIERNTIEALMKPSVLEALRLVPGVSVIQSGARGAATSLFVRGGASTFNKVLIDGVPVNDIGGAFDFADLSTTGVERVEVLRDANSVLYGTDALAGVVNITTRRGLTRTPEVTYAYDAGAFGTQRHDVSMGGAAKRVDYFAAFSNFDTDNDVPNGAFRNRSFAGRAGWTAGGTDLSAVFRLGSARTGLPGASAFHGISDDSTKDVTDRQFSLSARSRISPRVETTVRVAAMRSTYDTLNPTPTGDPFDPFGYGPVYLGKTLTVDGANGYSVTGRAVLDYGGLYPTPYVAETNRQQLVGQLTYRVNDVVAVSGGVRVEHEDGTTKYSTSPTSATDRTNSGAFAELQAVGSRVSASGGLGYDHNEIFGSKTTPRVSVAAYLRKPSATDVLGDTKVTFNAGTGIKAPSIGQELSSLHALMQQAGNVVPGVGPIGAEKGRSVDAGIEQGLWQGRLRLRASIFDNRFSDLIEFVSVSALVKLGVPQQAAGASGFGAYVNSSSYEARGVEFSSEAAIGHVRAMASYRFLSAEVTASSASSALNPVFNPAFPDVPIGQYAPLVGGRPFRQPRSVGSLMLQYASGAVDVVLSGYFASKQDDSTFLDDEYFGYSMLLPNRDMDPGYGKVDVSAGYRLSPHVRWYLSVENLFDKAYQAAAGFPALPRSFRAGVTVKVGGDKRP